MLILITGVRYGIFVLALLIVAPWALTGVPSAQEGMPAAGAAGPPADVIREAQTLLAALGYATGPAEAGGWSDSLSRAYRAFLSDAGLPASEMLTPRGLRSLREVAKSEGVTAGTGKPADRATGSASDDLHRAVAAGDIDGVQAFLSGGVAVDGRDRRGWTPLMHAANKGYVLLVETLLKAGAAPDIRAPDGATALFMAVMNGHPEAIALLMRAGASISIRGPRGLTAVDAARLIYGNNKGQRPVPDDAEVHALLGGMTWEDAVKAAVAERRVETDAAAIEASLGLDRTARAQVQRRLATLGFSPGPADGVFGHRTRLAISRWQKAEGLSGTSYLTRKQADTLVVGGEEEKEERERIAQQQAEREARENAKREEAEPELWALIKASGDPSDFEAYLEAYPGGVYEELARQRLNTLIAEDDAAYAQAVATETEAAYEGYLSAYPTGRHVAVAREALARERATMRPGKVFRDCAECPEMVVVPAGNFTMGSPSSDEWRSDNEGPQHRVTIPAPFAVGKYEVTRDDYGRFVKETGWSKGAGCEVWKYEWSKEPGYSWKDPGFSQGRSHPVTCVGWEDVKAYAGWLSEKTGKEYRLLSEAEWEYAARAGSRTSWYWGNSIDDQCHHANGAGTETSHGVCDDGYDKTAPTGSFEANGFGLHDMHGNVLEWVEDCWHGDYEGAPMDGSAWTTGGDCGRHVLRGGSWLGSWISFRSAFRVGGRARRNSRGFRIARTLTP